MKDNIKKIFSKLSIYFSSLFIILFFCGVVSIPLLLFSFISINAYIGVKKISEESEVEQDIKEKTISKEALCYKKDYQYYNHPKNLNKNKVLVRKKIR